MKKRFLITLAQLNPCVGNIDANVNKLRKVRAQAATENADLILTPELYISGYPPEDLVLNSMFISEIRNAVEKLLIETADGGPAILLGAPWIEKDKMYNAVLLLDKGKLQAVRYKVNLPNYGVFDEKRVFNSGPIPSPIEVRGLRLGVPICEDIWTPDVVKNIKTGGGEFLLVSNGSPFDNQKMNNRLQNAISRVIESKLPMVYLNQVGGQDEIVFDGASFVLNTDQKVSAYLPAWEESIVTTTWTRGLEGWSCAQTNTIKPKYGLVAIYRAMVLGLRDYVAKNRFPGIILGISGGIDSTLSATVAVDALGADKVRCVMMPSPYTSNHSLEDALEVAKRLGVKHTNISISSAMLTFESMLTKHLGVISHDLTEENLQARLRGIILMALSNKFGYMVLSTSNKSEISIGYTTLYGDMCGGYSVLKDVYKSTVFKLCRWRNSNKPTDCYGPNDTCIPPHIISKPPSAELKPGQKDIDTIPIYSVLDKILIHLIEKETPLAEIIANGYDKDTVLQVWRMLNRAEYKRYQSPPGVKLTCRSFGKERRYPITNAFTDTYKLRDI
ncbi:glutamine-dependent NAD(+) synthase [Candidatus Endolissoclinum faulkneri L5]|uniref:Glutamine-dependent NAD(+) synthetase n=1 Tax=Candidatus Endolissoclinum faulkneri L5 TaxID=1401328 RepID=V9TUE8_9PROT|nr:NAD+ synthase [Candidatus Endolissoclinum faulkneri]AHC73313.1 glutamine-dependent NAD(+) synthase [Candidatus Endolissoclinum faulkneri L5]